jgi:hypothetical protein
MNSILLISLVIPLMSIAAGMWFGRNAPHRPEYDRIG